MMKYIRENRNSYTIVKASKTYAKITNLSDAVFIRDFLVENDWDLNKVPQIILYDDNYLVLTVYEDKIYILAKYRQKPSKESVERLVKKHRRNPNKSKYGLNILKVFDTYVIKKQIAGDDYIFGYYDTLEDCEFVRNFLMEHNWNVNEFEPVNYCEDSDDYKVVYVIDDNVYVLDSFYSKNIDLEKCYEDFLAKIYKHKYGMANYPHLDLLKDKISQLEEEMGVKVKDDFWDFGNVAGQSNALDEIIFTLTPFQKSIYDSIGNESSFEDIKRALIRYKSKNFDEKIEKNLNELIEMDLVVKDGESYKKIKG